ncbi:MAG: transaldolase, partial [Aliifodinibius sp.]|nr:transaldolase [Fodinibius sp.]NIW99005.1 transaldolase [Phycisphaerae bacterium]NIY24763.1 transaldolase [Fodinibius sp.]
MNPLLKLIEYGQSYWLDNLTRGMIKSGDLKKRVTEQGLRGVTSNPAIFNKAISKSGDYDDQIRELVQQKKSVPEIYEALVVKDVQDACDILRPVYDESDSQDGFVSLEVSPHLAHDTHGTMGEARRLFGAVNRPNVFIKIPGTPAGVPAIEEMLYEGININITLLFSIEAYAEVARAYIRALERRAEERKSVNDVASVASFFLSRIDVLGDQLLGQQIRPRVEKGQTALPERLIGKVAIANAKVAYQRFKEIFSGDRWQALAEKGASVQRVLWASSSTKDPLYSRVRYVEPLIGPRTVNTMPEETIEAFATSGVIRENSVEAEVAEAENILRSLPEAGVDLDKMTWELINEGIQKFVDPYDSLMKTLFSKRKLFQSDKLGRQTMEFSDYHAKLSEAYTSLDTRQFSRRIYEKDPFLWQDEPQQRNTILNRLGWLSSIDEFLKEVENIKQVAREVKEAGFTKVVLLGMGGSSLCPEVCRQTFGSKPGWPELLVLDNTAPQAVQDVDSQIKLDKTLFVVSSKSGTTTETMSFYQYFYDQVLK